MRNKQDLHAPEALDGFCTLHEILTMARDRYAGRDAYRTILSGAEDEGVSFAALAARTDALRAALSGRGLQGVHAAIIGENCPEWVEAYLALVSGIGVAVPIDGNLPAETIATQLRFADAEAVFVSERCAETVFAALRDCPGVRRTILLRGNAAADETLRDLIAEGEALLRQKGEAALPPPADPDALAAIIFTSGTTGPNKGVMLTNRNILSMLLGCARLLRYPAVSLSVLPVHHTFELHAHLMSALYCGTTVVFNDSLKYVRRNLERFSPEMTCMVPLMADLLVKNVKKEIRKSGKEAQFDRLVSLSRKLLRAGIDLRRQLFAAVRKPLGGRLFMIVCGGAPLSQDTADFLYDIGVTVYNGYGITECAPVAAVNPLSRPRRHSVGMVLPTLRARIAGTDETGSGEIQLRGECVTAGYYKAPESTEKIFTADGWLRTGDLGYLDADGYLYIRGRLKNLIILPNGKNVCPEELEEALQRAIPDIRECIVFEDADNTGIFALCYLDPAFYKAHGLPDRQAARDYLLPAFEAFNKTLPTYRRIRDFDVTETEFEKTSTKKIRRFKAVHDN